MKAARHDAIVVGGGLVGLAATVVVARAGLDVLHVAPPGRPDRRTSALMGLSVDFLRETGLVPDPAAIGHPLRRIRIIDATRRLLRAPETLFDSAEAGLDAFGWNFSNTALAAAFEAHRPGLPGLAVSEASAEAIVRVDGGWRLTLDDLTLEAPLLVGADGKASPVRVAGGFATREHPFAEAALVADLALGRPLDETSVEFHYPHGPFTLVPAGTNRANLVWIDERGTLEAARDSTPEALRDRLLERSQRLFGTIEILTPPVVFPLSTLAVERAGGGGIVLVGEAAHAFPPIGAQGLNLGLRDVADLGKVLARIDRTVPGWAEAASAVYAEARAPDLARTGGMVDALFRSLLSDLLPAQALRAGGLWALRTLPGLRKQAFAAGMGGRRAP